MSEKEDNSNSGDNGEIRKELKEFLSELEEKKEGESLVEKEEKEGEKDSENNVTIKKSDAVLIKVKDSLVNLRGRDFRVIGRDIHIFKRVEVGFPKEIKKILVLGLLLLTRWILIG